MFSTGFVDGLVLAAIVQDDRYGRSAEGGLAPGLARVVNARLTELAAMAREERHRVVRVLVRTITAPPPDAALSARARAIVCGSNVPSRREPWVAPIVRRGFRASRGLRVTLRRLALASSEHERGLDPVGRELALVAEAPWR